MKTINTLSDIQSVISEQKMVLTYFTTSECNLCKSLFPKVEQMLKAFPEIVSVRSETNIELAIVGEYGVFTVPTLILFVEGKETIRRSRQIGIEEFSNTISRYYDMIFE